MKQVIPVIIFVFLSGSLAVHGQFTESMGLKAGISLANQSYQFTPVDYTLETDPVTGPGIAVFTETFKGSKIVLESDIVSSHAANFRGKPGIVL